MTYYLAKTDPETYSISDFAKQQVTTWDGVRNPTAVNALKSMQVGDRVLIYHSQGETTVVGLAEVLGNSRPDPNDPRSWLVDFKLLKQFDPPYITLRQIKESGLFADLALVRQSRLSTMPLPNKFIDWLKLQGLEL